MKYKSTLAIMLVSLLAIIPMVPMTYAEGGPATDILRHLVIPSPDADLIALQTDVTDLSPGMIRTADIEKHDVDGKLVTGDPGFHMGYIAHNIRDTATIQAYYRPEITYWPLADVEFRHALVHCYDQMAIIPPIYGYIVTPVRSLVPPAQGRYYNPGVPEHDYDPGDFASPAGEHSTVGILKAAGYNIVDADSSGTFTDVDYWTMPNGDPLPKMVFWTPLMEVAPTSFQHGAEWVTDLGAVGLAATVANGEHGMLNEGRDFGEYTDRVFDTAKFDGYMVFWSLSAIPGQLPMLLHTSEDSLNYPGRRNACGVNDPADGGVADTIDELTDIVRYSLDLDEIEAAAKEVQTMLYTPDLPRADNFALAYMTLYSRSYFNVFDENLRGIVKSPGFGSYMGWTINNMYWAPGTERTEKGKTVIIHTNGLWPDSLNPCYGSTVYEWRIMGATQSDLLTTNPYNHADRPAMALDWTTTETVTGMEIDITLRDDVEWQDGKLYTAYDAEFCLEFLRDYQVPRYAASWEQLVDVVVTDATHFTIIADEAGVDLFYDFMGLATLLPEHIWNRFGDPTDPLERQAVLDYDPTEAYNAAPGYTAGPNPPPTNLFGTGPWIFQFYDPVGMYDDLWKNPNWYRSTADITSDLEEMFWEVGDATLDGVNDAADHNAMSIVFGTPGTAPDYLEDVNSDGIVDTLDVAIYAYHIGWQRTWP